MSIQSGDGVLEILDGTLKVSRLDIQDISGLDVGINTLARNMVLLRDDLTAAETPGGAVTSSTGVTRTQNTDLVFTGGYVYWPIKVPNAWTMQFNVYDNLIFSFANTSAPASANASDNHGGYKMVFDSVNARFSFYYQGSEIVATRTAYTTGQWSTVLINYEYGGISVSIDGRQTMNYALTHGEDAYTGEYIGFAGSATSKLKDIKLTNGDKWQYVPGSNAAAIAYMNGNVGIGSSSPQKTLDVGGDVKISGNLVVAGTTFTVDSQNLSIKDKIIELAGGNTDGDSNVGMIMTTGGSSNVTVGYRGEVGELMIGYTSNVAEDSELTPKVGTNLPVKVYGDLDVTRALSGSTVSGDGYLLSNVTLSQVVDYGNTTSNTVQFNATDVALKTVGNVAIGTTTATIDLAIGDANTGLNQEGEDELAVYTAGSERVRVDSDGYVGISTSEPTANLHVVGAQYINDLPTGAGTSSYTHNVAPLTLTSTSTTDTTATSVLNLTRPASSDTNVASRASLKLSRWSADTPTASRSRLDVSLASGIYTNEVTPLTLQANQKVGIMNTSPGHTLSVGSNLWVNDGSSNILTVYGNAYVTDRLTVEAFRISATTFDSLEAVTLAGGNTTSSNIEISNTMTSTSQTTGALVVAGGVGIGKDLYTTNVRASSYIGIGTVPPEASLHIGPKNSDHIYLASGDNDYGWKLDTHDQGAGEVPFRIIKRTSDVDSTVVTIKNQNGYVGIGTTNPGALLDLYSGSLNGASIQLNSQGSYTSTITQKSYSSSDRSLQFTNYPYAGSNPAYQFLTWNSTDNGWNTPFVITGDGNVGIGTSSPAVKLDVVGGNIGFDYGRAIEVSPSLASGWPNGTTKLIEVNWGTGDEVRFFTPGSQSATQKMVINSYGNVGIGTTSPGIVLDVGSSLSNPQIGRNYAVGSVHDADKRDAIYFGRWDGTTRDFLGMKCRVDTHTNLGVGDYSNQSKIEFYTWGNNYAQSREVMCIRSDGNVGIGTARPRQRLEVADGHIAIVQNAWKSEGADDQLAGKIDFHLGGDSGQLTTPVAAIEAYDKFQTYGSYLGALAFKTQGTERMRINEYGNVGIGTASPASKLTFYEDYVAPAAGSTYAANQTTNGISWTSTEWTAAFDANAPNWYSSTAVTTARIWFRPRSYSSVSSGQLGAHGALNIGTGYTGTLADSPNICLTTNDRVGINIETPSTPLHVNGTITCTSLSQTSDDRVKYNEQNVSNALTLINQLKPQKYEKIMKIPSSAEGEWIPTDAEWENVKENYDYGVELGFIAQDVRNIPELAFLVTGEETRTDTNTISVNEYSNLTIETQNTYTPTYTYVSNEEPISLEVYSNLLADEQAQYYELSDTTYQKSNVNILVYSNLTADAQQLYTPEINGYSKQIETQTPLSLDYKGLFVVAIGAIQELHAELQDTKAQLATVLTRLDAL